MTKDGQTPQPSPARDQGAADRTDCEVDHDLSYKLDRYVMLD